MTRWRILLCKIPDVCSAVQDVLFPLGLSSDALKRCYLLSPLSPKENSSAVVSHLETVYHIVRCPDQLLYDMTFFYLQPQLFPNLNFSVWLQNVEHYSKAICKPDRTNMPTNFNLELLDKQCSPLISAMMPKLKSKGTPEIPWSIL